MARKLQCFASNPVKQRHLRTFTTLRTPCISTSCILDFSIWIVAKLTGYCNSVCSCHQLWLLKLHNFHHWVWRLWRFRLRRELLFVIDWCHHCDRLVKRRNPSGLVEWWRPSTTFDQFETYWKHVGTTHIILGRDADHFNISQRDCCRRCKTLALVVASQFGFPAQLLCPYLLGCRVFWKMLCQCFFCYLSSVQNPWSLIDYRGVYYVFMLCYRTILGIIK